MIPILTLLLIQWWNPFAGAPKCVGDSAPGITCITIEGPGNVVAITIPAPATSVYRGDKKLTTEFWYMQQYTESGQGGQTRQRVVIKIDKKDLSLEKLIVLYRRDPPAPSTK